MSIFYLGGEPEKVPQAALLPEMYQERFFLPGTIHGGDNYLVMVYLNDAHSESDDDVAQFEVDYISGDLVLKAHEIDPSLGAEFYLALVSECESFAVNNDGKSDFAEIIRAWPEGVAMSNSDLYAWAEDGEGYLLPKNDKTRLVRFIDTLEETPEEQVGVWHPDGTVTCLCCGGTLERNDYWITSIDIDGRTVPKILGFVDKKCLGHCETCLSDCKIPVWDCPEFVRTLSKKEYKVRYEEIISHDFYVDASSPEDVPGEFDLAARENLLDFSDGDVIETQITKVVDPNGKETLLNSSYGDLEIQAMNPSKIAIPLGDGFSLVAEKNPEPGYKEIFVYLRRDEDECIYQDLAIVSEEYSYKDDGNGGATIAPIHGRYSVKVYSDPDNEDFKHDFVFGRYLETPCPYSEDSMCSISPDANECRGEEHEQAECAYRKGAYHG